MHVMSGYIILNGSPRATVQHDFRFLLLVVRQLLGERR